MSSTGSTSVAMPADEIASGDGRVVKGQPVYTQLEAAGAAGFIHQRWLYCRQSSALILCFTFDGHASYYFGLTKLQPPQIPQSESDDL